MLLQIDMLPGYTLTETMLYFPLLVLGLILIEKGFRKLGIKSHYLIKTIIPYIVIAGALRVYVDKGLLETNFFTISPGFYFLMGTIILGELFLTFWYFKKDWAKYYELIGWAMAIPLLVFHIPDIKEIIGPAAIITITGITYLLLKRYKHKLLKAKENILILTATIFDVTTTSMSVFGYGYGEQHLIPNLLIQLTGNPLILFLVKIPVVIAALWLVDKEVTDKQLNGFTKTAILILILAPAVRDLIRLILLV